MNTHIFNQCLYFWLYQIVQAQEKVRSFIQVILCLAIYLSSCNSWSLTQDRYQVTAIVHLYPSFKSCSGNLGPNLSISSQAQATCWCLKDTYYAIHNDRAF
jgi:hypothetical protein